MKKKCTNSACRRAFTPVMEEGGVQCPCCGKSYPRLSIPEAERRALILSLSGMPELRERVALVKQIRTSLGWSLREAKEAVDRMSTQPLVIPLADPSQARVLAEEWASLGVNVSIDSREKISQPRKEGTYRVLMTGHTPEGRTHALALLRKANIPGYRRPMGILRTLKYQKLVVAREMAHGDAQQMVRTAREQGVFLELFREKQKKDPPTQ